LQIRKSSSNHVQKVKHIPELGIFGGYVQKGQLKQTFTIVIQNKHHLYRILHAKRQQKIVSVEIIKDMVLIKIWKTEHLKLKIYISSKLT
jgi:hypothetical protein